MDKISYAIGMNIAANLRQSGVETIDIESLTRGLKTIFGDEKPEMTNQEVGQILQKFFVELETKLKEKAAEEGRKFLEENGKRPAVTTLKSGLQYEVLKEGSGRKPKATDKVRCHYVGKLINGTTFDSSIDRGEPAVFPVNGVIQGWVEALQLMAEGSKWKLYIPYNLGYGAQGAGQSIPPYATLIFEVELIEIV